MFNTPTDTASSLTNSRARRSARRAGEREALPMSRSLSSARRRDSLPIPKGTRHRLSVVGHWEGSRVEVVTQGEGPGASSMATTLTRDATFTVPAWVTKVDLRVVGRPAEGFRIEAAAEATNDDPRPLWRDGSLPHEALFRRQYGPRR